MAQITEVDHEWKSGPRLLLNKIRQKKKKKMNLAMQFDGASHLPVSISTGLSSSPGAIAE